MKNYVEAYANNEMTLCDAYMHVCELFSDVTARVLDGEDLDWDGVNRQYETLQSRLADKYMEQMGYIQKPYVFRSACSLWEVAE